LENGSTVNFKAIGQGSVNWIKLAHDRDK